MKSQQMVSRLWQAVLVVLLGALIVGFADNARAATITVNSTADDGVETVTDEVIGTGNAATTTFTDTLSNAPVQAGSVNVDDQTESLNDNGDGQIVRPINNEDVGDGNGAATNFTGTLSGAPLEPDSVLFQTTGPGDFSDTPSTIASESGTVGYIVGAAVNDETLHAWSGSETSYSETLNNPPVVPGSVYISMESTSYYSIIDNGNGQLVWQSGGCCPSVYTDSLDNAPVIGTINYMTGAVVVDLGDFTDYPTGNSTVDYQRSLGTVNYTTGVFNVTFPSAPNNTTDILVDYNEIAGTIDYATGALSVTFAAATGNGDDVEVDYDWCGTTCTLRAAIEVAAANAGMDTILFSLTSPPNTITLTNGEFDCIPDSLTITGPGATNLIIDVDGTDGDYLFNLDSSPDDSSSNECSGDGGATVTITGLTITDAGSYPPIVSGRRNHLVLTNMVVDSNDTTGGDDEDGGQIVINGTGVLTNVAVSNNTVDTANQYEGAGIYIAGEGGTVTLTNVMVTDNVRDGGNYNSDFCGGGIYIGGFAKEVKLTNVTVDGNELHNTGATSSHEVEGAGVCINGTNHNVIIRNSTISNNMMVSDNDNEDGKGGGGLSVNGGGSLVFVQNTRIVDNTSDLDGGGVLVTAGEVMFQNVTIDGNSAGGRDAYNYERGGGGGIAVQGRFNTFELVGSSVTNNTSDFHGGGILVHGAPWNDGNGITLLSSRVIGNDAVGYGGGISAWSGLVELFSSSVTGNDSGAGGGGVANFKDLDDRNDHAFWDDPHLGRVGQIRLYGASIAGNTTSGPTGSEQCYGSLSRYLGGAPFPTDVCVAIFLEGARSLFGGGDGGGCVMSATGDSSAWLLLGAAAAVFVFERRRRRSRA